MKPAVSFENVLRPLQQLGMRFEPGKTRSWPVSHGAVYEPLEAMRGLASEKVWHTPTVLERTVPSPDSDLTVVKLFDARANAKLVAAQLSMHLSAEWRGKVYRQIDDLLDAAEWEESDGVLDPRSMKTFLRFVIFADAKAVPSLGMASNGFILAAWRRDTRRLTIEFQPGDRCRAVISHVSGDDTSIMTFTGQVPEGRSFLQRENFLLG